MDEFSFSRALFWGVVTYLIEFYLLVVLSTYHIAGVRVNMIAGYVVPFICVWGAAYALRISDFVDALKYSISFTLVHVVLDAIVILPALGAAAFASVYVWSTYAVVLLTPALYYAYHATLPATTTQPRNT